MTGKGWVIELGRVVRVSGWYPARMLVKGKVGIIVDRAYGSWVVNPGGDEPVFSAPADLLELVDEETEARFHACLAMGVPYAA